jgi:uncharacterized protein (UPF0333 family)
MNNRAQVSVEYLIMIGVGVIIAALVILLAVNIIGLKDGVKQLIDAYRARTFLR